MWKFTGQNEENETVKPKRKAFFLVRVWYQNDDEINRSEVDPSHYNNKSIIDLTMGMNYTTRFYVSCSEYF